MLGPADKHVIYQGETEICKSFDLKKKERKKGFLIKRGCWIVCAKVSEDGLT